ncbi:hypothetical protein ACJX0J_040533 [Zea mays]
MQPITQILEGNLDLFLTRRKTLIEPFDNATPKLTHIDIPIPRIQPLLRFIANKPNITDLIYQNSEIRQVVVEDEDDDEEEHAAVHKLVVATTTPVINDGDTIRNDDDGGD